MIASLYESFKPWAEKGSVNMFGYKELLDVFIFYENGRKIAVYGKDSKRLKYSIPIVTEMQSNYIQERVIEYERTKENGMVF